LYLAAAGVGHLHIADFDHVELTNLQRQILYTSADVGVQKTTAATQHIAALNPGVAITAIQQRLDPASLTELMADVDIVLDGSDNFATRFAVNAACVRTGKPLIAGAVIGMEGQLAVFRPDRNGPCYRCVFADTGDQALSCSETGVLGPLPGVIGSLQAVEAIKVLTGLGEALDSRLLVVDALSQSWRRLNLRVDPACPVCQR
jgi:adenylyltransferase/sulfurtransferase